MYIPHQISTLNVISTIVRVRRFIGAGNGGGGGGGMVGVRCRDSYWEGGGGGWGAKCAFILVKWHTLRDEG